MSGFLLVACGDNTGNNVTNNAGNSVTDSNELFFECKIRKTGAGYGTKANITFNKANNSATVVTDLMNGPMLTHKADPSLTADKLIVKFYPKTLEGWVSDYPSTLNVNRDTLELTGNRKGTCKIIEKKSKF